MSTDYYLISRKARRRAMIGSIGFSGVQSFPGHPEVVKFIHDAIDSLGEWDDIQFLAEHAVYNIMEEDNWNDMESK